MAMHWKETYGHDFAAAPSVEMTNLTSGVEHLRNIICCILSEIFC